MSDQVVLKLSVPGQGDYIFTHFEIPEHIAFGGRQKLAVHEMVGGKRVIDAMGASEKPLQWSGRLMGPLALARARYLNSLRSSGKKATLTWASISYDVVVEEFEADFERTYNMPYRISCVVVQDNTFPVTTFNKKSMDDALKEDMTTMTGISAAIGDGPLSATLATLDSAIKAVSSFAAASQAAINSVIQPLAAVQARVTTLIGTTGSMLTNVSSFGGLLPGTSIARHTAGITQRTTAATQLPQLYNLQAAAGRMGTNLGQKK